MRSVRRYPSPAAAILTIAEIKAAVEAFDRGETNVFTALDAITTAVAAHQVTTASEPQRDAA
jgi:hypothetical protein